MIVLNRGKTAKPAPLPQDHHAVQQAEGGKMTTKKRSTQKKAAPKKRAARSLYFDRKDKRLLVMHLRWEFSKFFSCGFSMDFQDGEESLRLTIHRRLTPEAARGALNKLGINPKLIEGAVQSIAVRFGKHTPKLEQLAFDSWFHFVSQKSFVEKYKGILAAIPESRAKWGKRLKQCGRSWKDARLSREAVIHITMDLLKNVLGQQKKYGAIEQRLRRWENKQNRILHGVTSRSFTYGWDVLNSDP